MKRSQHKINYHGNRHKSDGLLLEDKPHDERLSTSDFENNLILTDKNMCLNNNNENYLNEKYAETSNKLIDSLNSLLINFSQPLKHPTKSAVFDKANNRMNLQLNDEDLKLSQENLRLQEKINKIMHLKAKTSGNIRSNEDEYFSAYNENPTQQDLMKLLNENLRLVNENEYLRKQISNIKTIKNNNSNNNNNTMTNNSKYHMDCLIQSMLGGMKELVYLLDNNNIEDINKDYIDNCSSSNNGNTDEQDEIYGENTG